MPSEKQQEHKDNLTQDNEEIQPDPEVTEQGEGNQRRSRPTSRRD